MNFQMFGTKTLYFWIFFLINFYLFPPPLTLQNDPAQLDRLLATLYCPICP